MPFIVNGLLFLGGIIAGWFVTTDADHYVIISFVAAMLFLVVGVALGAFWRPIIRWFKTISKRLKS